MTDSPLKTRDRSATGDRTRRAILDAAALEIALNPNATMAQVAQAARMARSTVHRYFPERISMLDALRQRADEEVYGAYAQVDGMEGEARAQLMRLTHAYFERAELLIAAYVSLSPADKLAASGASDANTLRLVERGQADGSIDSKLHPVWVEKALWGLLYASWITTVNGSVNRLDALNVLLESLDMLLTPRG